MLNAFPTLLLSITPRADVSYGLLDALVAGHLCLAVIVVTFWVVRSMRRTTTPSSREREMLLATKSTESRLIETQEQLFVHRGETADYKAHVNTLQGAVNSLRVRVEELEIELVARALQSPAPTAPAPVEAPEPKASLNLFQPDADAEPKVEPIGPACFSDEKLGLVYTERPGNPDDLTKIWGVGEVLQNRLHENGIYYYEQIANWSGLNIASFDALFMFKGRIDREQWVSQAAKLQLQTQSKMAA